MCTIGRYYTQQPFNETEYKDYLRNIKAENFVLSFLLLKDEKMLRTRINEECKFFTEVSQISYPPCDKARTDRASVKGKPMFYASIFTHQSKEIYLPRIVNLMETSAFFRDTQSVGRQVLTQSVWRNERELKLAMLPASKKYELPSDELNAIQNDFLKMSANGHVNMSQDAIFLGDLFAQGNYANTYNMTSYFVDYLLNESAERNYFDGVVYPSVPSKGLGMNVCLRKELINDGTIKCYGAYQALLIKDKMNSKLSPLFEGDVFETGEIKWRNSDEVNKAIESPYLFLDLLNL